MELAALLILAALLVWREYTHDRRVNELLDRIQFPQTVEAERGPEPSDELLYVPFEDDEAYEEAHKNGEVT